MNLPAYLLLLIFTFTLSNSQPTSTDQQAFMDHLRSLCGQSYAGEVAYPETPPRGFEDPLVAHFTHCEGNEIHIPFHVGENTSRTWMLELMDENVIHFKHDHRHPDGTPERMTDYGGYSTDEGNELHQFFPADDYTISLRDNLRSHIWTIELSDDLSTFSYSLYLYENLYFRADFDLNNPID
jgi:hypothetical protein